MQICSRQIIKEHEERKSIWKKNNALALVAGKVRRSESELACDREEERRRENSVHAEKGS